ncbi:MAG: VWA domain-containing protein [Terracidiphilus sp.]
MIDQKLEPEAIGQQLGAGGVDNLVANAGRICGYEEQRIALKNQGPIASLQIEFHDAEQEESHIEHRLLSAPPSSISLRFRLKAVYYWAVAAALTAGGLALTLFTFAPFRLGRIACVFAAGVAIVTPFLVENALECQNRLLKALNAAAALAALASLMLLAHVRANVLDEQLRQGEEQAVVIDGAEPASQPETNFYSKSNRPLHLALLLLAFAMETGAAFALREAWLHVPDSSEDWNGMRRKLSAVRERKAQIARMVIDLRNEPAIFAVRFWRDFYRAMLTNAVRSALSKSLIIPLAFAALAVPVSRAQANENLVVAIDLTASVAATGPDGKSEFQKNIDAVTGVLAQVPAASRVTVIGITDHSFAQPYILMSARTGADPGYFGERLSGARGQLVRTWRQRSARLDPHFRRTDILGALQLASQIFAQEPHSSRRALVIFSDMRQDTAELDLESTRLAPAFAAIARRCQPLPKLHGLQVSVLGADDADRSRAYWESLQGLWISYFRSAGADLRQYSAMRELAIPR